MGMKVSSLPASSHISNQENLFLEQLHKLLVIGFIDNNAFRSYYAKNPFNFNHYDINFVALYVDGKLMPAKPNASAAAQFRECLLCERVHTAHSDDRQP